MDRSYRVSRSLPTNLLDEGPKANERLTASLAVALLVLLAVEGATLLVIRVALPLHVFIGILLAPVVVLKLGSTVYRFARFYLGSRAYRRRGPPAVIPRLLGPVVVVLTLVLFATGFGLLAIPAGPSLLLTAHKAAFVLWFGAMTLHVLIHALDLPGKATADWRPRAAKLPGAPTRRSVVIGAIAVGAVLGFIFLPASASWSHWLTGVAG